MSLRQHPEIKLEGSWLKEQIMESIKSLHTVGFHVRAVVADNHSTNVSAFSMLRKDHNKDRTESSIILDGRKISIL